MYLNIIISILYVDENFNHDNILIQLKENITQSKEFETLKYNTLNRLNDNNIINGHVSMLYIPSNSNLSIEDIESFIIKMNNLISKKLTNLVFILISNIHYKSSIQEIINNNKNNNKSNYNILNKENFDDFSLIITHLSSIINIDHLKSTKANTIGEYVSIFLSI
jgi:hypothetical protein